LSGGKIEEDMTIGRYGPPPLEDNPAALLGQQMLLMARSGLSPEAATDTRVTMRGMAEALFRHQRMFIRVFASVMAITVAVTLLTPRAYESRMKILVQNGRRNVSITPEKAERVITNEAVTEEEINSEVELIDSNDLLQSVSKQLESGAIAPAQRENAVRNLEKALKINPIRKSNVIEVEYLDRSPERATHVLQLVSAEYLDKHLRLQRPAGGYDFFRGEADRYKQQLEEAEAQLAEFEKSKNFVGLGEKKNALMKQINQADDDIRAADATVEEIDQRLKTNVSLAGNIAPRMPTQTRVVPNQSAAQTLSTMLVDLKNRRTTMLTKFRPDDRLVQDLDQQIAQTTESLDAMSKSSATEATSDVNTVWQELASARAKDEIVRNGQTARHAALAVQKLASQTELAELQTLTVQYNELTRRVQEGGSNYKAFAEKRDEAQIADAMDRQKLLNVAIAEPPTSSVMPVRPRRMMNLALGLFTAVFVACCMVFLAEISREAVSTPAELEACGGYPVLATTPFRDKKEEIYPKRGDALLDGGKSFGNQNMGTRLGLQTRQPLIAQNAQSAQQKG
jgi:uncharacterized protein involved in exopolysaccharide biosynthesis